MKKARKSLIVFLVSLLVGVTAALTVPDRSLGGSISYDVSIEGDGPDVSYGFLPQFDPNLGPLNSVIYTGSLGLQSLFFFSDVTQAVNVNYTGPVYVYLAGPGSSPLEPLIVGPVVSGTQAIVGYEAYISAGPLDLSGNLAPASYFYGTGEIAVAPVWSFDLDVPYEGAIIGFGGEITFTYTYGVPEPPGLLLASIAAILLLYLIVRRRLTKRAGCV